MIRRVLTGVGAILLVAQAILGARVALRLARTARGKRIERSAVPLTGARASVLLPVLNEAHRLEPCLRSASGFGDEVAEILVIDGGSTDGTQALVERWTGADARIRLVDASPIPDNWNGKAWGLQVGFEESKPDSAWVLTLDADVRPDPALVRSLIAHAQQEDVAALSAATLQTLSGAAEGLVHPAMLATLVYRFGIPGQVATGARDIQANGQCFLVKRNLLLRSGGFASVRGSVCEDVTLARNLAASGARVGFYETDGLISVAMYDGWRDALTNWTRSLPMRDHHWGAHGLLGLAEVIAVQAAPLPLAVGLAVAGRRANPRSRVRAAWLLNSWLAAMRIGVLAGMGRAYRDRPPTYWCSPLTDLPVAAALVLSAFRRTHTWRGRTIVRSSIDSDG